MSNPMNLNSILNPLCGSQTAPNPKDTTALASSPSLAVTQVGDASLTSLDTKFKSIDASPLDLHTSKPRDESKRRELLKLPSPVKLPSTPAENVGDVEMQSSPATLVTVEGKMDDSLSPTGAAGPSKTVTKGANDEFTPEDNHEATNTTKTSRGGTTTSKRQIPADQECMNPNCNFSKLTGQPESNWRTCILDHFGRNKAETNKIKTILVWCRKCYQHGSYEGSSWPDKKCDLILEQMLLICADEGCQDITHDEIFQRERLDRPCSDHCEVSFNITMRAGELKRMKELSEKFQNDTQAYIDAADDSDAAVQQYANETKDQKTVRPNEKGHSRFKRQSKSYKRAPIEVLKEFQQRFMGTNKTRAECIAAVKWCKDKFEAGEIDDLLRFEFILQCPRVLREIDEQRANVRANKSVSKKRKAEQASEGDNNVVDKKNDTLVAGSSKKHKLNDASEENEAVANKNGNAAVENPPKKRKTDHTPEEIDTVAEKKENAPVKATPMKRKADEAFADTDSPPEANGDVASLPRTQRLKINVSDVSRAVKKHKKDYSQPRGDKKTDVTKSAIKAEPSEVYHDEDSEMSSDTDSSTSHISANIDWAARQTAHLRGSKGKRRSTS